MFCHTLQLHGKVMYLSANSLMHARGGQQVTIPFTNVHVHVCSVVLHALTGGKEAVVCNPTFSQPFRPSCRIEEMVFPCWTLVSGSGWRSGNPTLEAGSLRALEPRLTSTSLTAGFFLCLPFFFFFW